MRHLVISRNAEANVWIDEDVAGCRADAPLAERRRVPAGDLALVRTRVTVELAVHLGPRISYGLLGAELAPVVASGTEIEVPHLPTSATAGRSAYPTTLDWARSEQAAVGLDGEFAPAVADALARELALSSPAWVRVHCAACSPISSSSHMMGSLALAVVRIARMVAPDDAGLTSCVIGAFREH